MKLLNLLIPVFLLATLSSCSKDGDPGPAGAAGAPGANGANGNANVTVYNFGTKTITYQTTYTLKNLSQAKMDSSFILAYYNPAVEAETSWYPMPGLGSGSAYQTRSYVYKSAPTSPDYIFGVRLMKADLSGSYMTPTVFTKFRVFLVPANTILAGRAAVPSAASVDYNDYAAVCRYYNIAP